MTKTPDLHLSGDAQARAAYAALVREAAGGDREAMERLLLRAQEVAYRFSLLVCGHPEDAEDVMQEALVKTYQHVRRIREPEAFRTWLYKTVRTACLMKRRRRADEPARHESIEQGGVSEDGERRMVPIEDKGRAADDRVMDAWIGARLRRALGALPPAFRAIVVMREIEGLSTREVASIMRISEANVKTRLHRAHVLMRSHLDGVPRQ